MKYDILLLTSGPRNVVVSCLQSIRANSDDYRVIWLDNGAPKEIGQAAREQLFYMPSVELRVPRNIGIAKGYNACLAVSTAPYVVIMNDDIEVVSGWLESCWNAFTAEIGMVTPCVTNGGWIRAGSLGAPKNRVLVTEKALPMYCTMISRECVEEVGYFDERFRHGCGADDDYCRRARQQGFSFAVDLKTVVKHHHQASSLPMIGGAEAKRRAHLEAASLLEEKYGD